MPPRARALDLRLLLPRLALGFRSRGGSLSGSRALGFEVLALGLSSAMVTRSCGPSRNSDNDAASPNSGSRRPLVFFRPHAICYARHPMRQPKRTGFKGALSEN